MARTSKRVLGWTLAAGVVVSVALGCKTNNINATTNNNAESYTVGPAGMSLTGPEQVQVDIPAMALTQNTQVTLATVTTGFPALPSGSTSVGSVFEFTPAGQTFAGAVQIYVPYTGSGSDLTLLTSEEGTSSWSAVSGTMQTNLDGVNYVQGNTLHFSYYTVVSGMGEAPGDGGPTFDAAAPMDSGTDAVSCTPCNPEAGVDAGSEYCAAPMMCVQMSGNFCCIAAG
jgi:hypothetical protein